MFVKVFEAALYFISEKNEGKLIIESFDRYEMNFFCSNGKVNYHVRCHFISVKTKLFCLTNGIRLIGKVLDGRWLVSFS